LIRTTIDTCPNTGRVLMEEKEHLESIPKSRKDALVHDLILVVKSAMAKVNARDQMWCDILAKTESDIRRVVDEAIR
jgi:hypothetical protein